MDIVDRIKDTLRGVVEPYGFECYHFKTGWYNDCVTEPFKFNYDPDTLAFLFISTPSMFEKALIPFLVGPHCVDLCDPINRCINHHLTQAVQAFPDEDIEKITYYDKNEAKQPRVLVQTAGHVAGVAFYYQRSSLTHDPWDKDKNIIGVSIHPRFGGWFGMRGILIFKNIRVPTLLQVPPPDVLSEEQKVEVLNRFNGNFRDGTYRDIIPVEDRYSEAQWTYFSTPSKDRRPQLEHLRQQALNDKCEQDQTDNNK